ncbi:MAG TPA: hypothetical protein ENN46_04410, partial [Candidatus Woesearchaeota archaeon]|nr:hypothetical protein [Candidatus Woesearchaeota archaeon]
MAKNINVVFFTFLFQAFLFSAFSGASIIYLYDLPPYAGEFTIDLNSLDPMVKDIVIDSLSSERLTYFSFLKNVKLDGDLLWLNLSSPNEIKLIIDETGIYFEEKTQSYIVELESPALIPMVLEIKDSEDIKHEGDFSVQSFVARHEDLSQAYISALKNERDSALSEIRSALSLKKSEFQPTNEFFVSFNGFAVEMTPEQAKIAEKSKLVRKVHEDYKVHIALYDSADLINATSVWSLNSSLSECDPEEDDCLTGKGVIISIIDTGVDYTHPDLGGCFGEGCKVAKGHNVFSGSFDPMDDNGHGTHCAGIAAGNGVLKGIAPDATIYAFKVLNLDGSGYLNHVLEGIERSLDPNRDGSFEGQADVISMSLGGSGNPDDALSTAVNNAVSLGSVVVVAAGNRGPSESTIGSPGTAKHALTVAASDKEDMIASFSSRGPVSWGGKILLKPDVTAPGVYICAARSSLDRISNDDASRICLDGEHLLLSGTSMATPHVAGLAAILKQKNPDSSPLEIRNMITSTSKDLGFEAYAQGFGRIDALKAVSARLAFSGDLDFGLIPYEIETLNATLFITNLQDVGLSVEISVDSAVDFAGEMVLEDAVIFNMTNFNISAGETKEVTVSLNFPSLYDGHYNSRINVFDGEINYTLLAFFSRTSLLNISVIGGEKPSILIHNLDFSRRYSSTFSSNNSVISLVSGNYVAYAYEYNSNQAPSYLLVSNLTVKPGKDNQLVLSTSDARLFTIVSSNHRSEKVGVYQRLIGFLTYKNKLGFCSDYTDSDSCVNNDQELICGWSSGRCLDVFSGLLNHVFLSDKDWDLEIYLSNKPDYPLNTDYLFKYIAR